MPLKYATKKTKKTKKEIEKKGKLVCPVQRFQPNKDFALA